MRKKIIALGILLMAFFSTFAQYNMDVDTLNVKGGVKMYGNPIDSLSYARFDTTYTTTGSESAGSIFWDEDDATLSVVLEGGTILQSGQEAHFYAKATEAISNGEVVEFAGVQGSHVLIKVAVPAEIIANPHYLVGVATQDFAINEFGYVTWFGKVNDVYTDTPNNGDSQDWAAGDVLYWDNTTGQLTKTEPDAPERRIIIAAVIQEQTGAAQNGKLLIRPTFGLKLSDLDDINGTALDSSGQFPIWDNTNEYFDFTANINNFAVDATNISQVEFTRLDGTTFRESFDHVHTEYALDADLDALYDSIAVHLDTLQDLRVDVNAIYDTLAIHLDTLQSLRVDVNAIYDTLAIHLDTLQQLREDLNAITQETPLIFSQTANKQIINTTTKTSLIGTGEGSVTIGGGTLAVGDVIRITMRGVYNNSTGGTESAQIGVTLGATSLGVGDITLLDVASNWGFDLNIDLVVRSVGASGSVIMGGIGFTEYRTGGFPYVKTLTQTSAVTLSTLVDLGVDISCTLSTASVGLSISSVTTTIEVLRP